MRKLVAVICIILLFSGIAILFWYNQWQYSLPTPMPQRYRAVKLKEHIDLSGKFQAEKSGPVFLHFFNPDCPCSRFNMPHFKLLAKKYGDKMNFAVVVITKDKNYTQKYIREKYDLNVPVLSDSTLAAACGVYSTPQAVLLDERSTLYYRGNYNRSRYCTDKKTYYAQMAIDSLLAQQQQPAFNKQALIAYGCSLPNCKK